ncbi:hypothetical protein CSUB01_04296 [Colletotrichum sublineola]|uniref:Uncharacterized protein n=1 Tax=Colletotrichum sublineola TaxID=1173701 RepID=A0A066X691_COLSU|nr:hypothetical protein CSUB01_04296 [Colletotrichum sublineola]
MSAPNPFIANGTCFHGPGKAVDEWFPCGNAVLGDKSCCQGGDMCLSSRACYNGRFGITYLAGCSDPESTVGRPGVLQRHVRRMGCMRAVGAADDAHVGRRVLVPTDVPHRCLHRRGDAPQRRPATDGAGRQRHMAARLRSDADAAERRGPANGHLDDNDDNDDDHDPDAADDDNDDYDDTGIELTAASDGHRDDTRRRKRRADHGRLGRHRHRSRLRMHFPILRHHLPVLGPEAVEEAGQSAGGAGTRRDEGDGRPRPLGVEDGLAQVEREDGADGRAGFDRGAAQVGAGQHAGLNNRQTFSAGKNYGGVEVDDLLVVCERLRAQVWDRPPSAPFVHLVSDPINASAGTRKTLLQLFWIIQ